MRCRFAGSAAVCPACGRELSPASWRWMPMTRLGVATDVGTMADGRTGGRADGGVTMGSECEAARARKDTLVCATAHVPLLRRKLDISHKRALSFAPLNVIHSRASWARGSQPADSSGVFGLTVWLGCCRRPQSAQWARWSRFPLCQQTFSDIMVAFKTVS
jgi:hypothetical protein